jgi:hypothetical protein
MTAREVQIRGHTVAISEGATPHDAQLTIDGVNVPLVYNEGFEGWGVEHTIFGFFPDLELLADHMIVSNPSLRIGHGGDGEHHDH